MVAVGNGGKQVRNRRTSRLSRQGKHVWGHTARPGKVRVTQQDPRASLGSLGLLGKDWAAAEGNPGHSGGQGTREQGEGSWCSSGCWWKTAWWDLLQTERKGERRKGFSREGPSQAAHLSTAGKRGKW